MQLNLLETPRLGQSRQGAREARERHELFLAEDFGVLCGVHWREEVDTKDVQVVVVVVEDTQERVKRRPWRGGRRRDNEPVYITDGSARQSCTWPTTYPRVKREKRGLCPRI